MAANAKEQKRREKRWGVQRWKDWVPPVMVFPVWIMGIEAQRRMCGGPKGMLGTLVLGLRGGEATGVGGRVAEGVQGVQDAVLGVGVGVGTGTGVGEASTALAVTEVQEVLASSGADPSMATGGCLWFPDLMVADPYHILPFALSAVLVLNLLPKTEIGARNFFGMAPKPGTVVMQSKWRLRVQRGLLMVAMAVGPLTMDLPAALHLYWISSSVLTQISSAIVARLMPLPTAVPPAEKAEQIFVMPTRDETKDT
jgi:inner membrane protein COX18